MYCAFFSLTAFLRHHLHTSTAVMCVLFSVGTFTVKSEKTHTADWQKTESLPIDSSNWWERWRRKREKRGWKCIEWSVCRGLRQLQKRATLEQLQPQQLQLNSVASNLSAARKRVSVISVHVRMELINSRAKCRLSEKMCFCWRPVCVCNCMLWQSDLPWFWVETITSRTALTKCSLSWWGWRVRLSSFNSNVLHSFCFFFQRSLLFSFVWQLNSALRLWLLNSSCCCCRCPSFFQDRWGQSLLCASRGQSIFRLSDCPRRLTGTLPFTSSSLRCAFRFICVHCIYLSVEALIQNQSITSPLIGRTVAPFHHWPEFRVCSVVFFSLIFPLCPPLCVVFLVIARQGTAARQANSNYQSLYAPYSLSVCLFTNRLQSSTIYRDICCFCCWWTP